MPVTNRKFSYLFFGPCPHSFVQVSWLIFIGVGTGGATGAMAPSLFGQNFLKIVPLFLKHNFYAENDSPGRG